MTDFQWTEEYTADAARAIEHSTWAVINPQDMLRAILKIHEKGGEATTHDLDAIREDLEKLEESEKASE